MKSMNDVSIIGAAQKENFTKAAMRIIREMTIGSLAEQ